MKKTFFGILIFCLALAFVPKVYAANDPICRPGFIEINAMPPDLVYNFGICRDQAISKNKCCPKNTNYSIHDICTTSYGLPGTSISVNEVWSKLSFSPYKVQSCQDLLNHTIVSDKDYCVPNNQDFFVLDPGTNKCVVAGKTETFKCISGSCDTAVGTVPVGNLNDFLTFALKLAFYASGGIILLMIISTGYTILTSSGNAEKLQAAQENIIALFSGLALIAFSLVLLQTIGADILGLPGFR